MYEELHIPTITMLLEIKAETSQNDGFYNPAVAECRSFPRTESGIKRAVRKYTDWVKEHLSLVSEKSEVVCLRLYATENTVYAVVWVYGYNSMRGMGKAGGYGYCSASAAAQEAFTDAGITFDENIAGAGDDAIETALLAIGEKFGLDGAFIVRAHA